MASESLSGLLKSMFAWSLMLSICLCYGYVFTLRNGFTFSVIVEYTLVWHLRNQCMLLLKC